MRVRGCAMIIRDGKLLTLVYDYPDGRLHAIPGGGLEDGETLETAVVRELREELGLEISLGPLRYVGDMMASRYVKQTLHVVFEGRIVAGEPAVNAAYTKANGLAWLDLDRLEETLLYPAVNRELLADRQARRVATRYVGDCRPRHWT